MLPLLNCLKLSNLNRFSSFALLECRMGFLQISYAFQQCKIFENRLKFDKVTVSLKVRAFLRHSVEGLGQCIPPPRHVLQVL